MRVTSVVAALVVLAVISFVVLRRDHSSAADPIVEQQARVPAPMGAVWCKSADTCPRRR